MRMTDQELDEAEVKVQDLLAQPRDPEAAATLRVALDLIRSQRELRRLPRTPESDEG